MSPENLTNQSLLTWHAQESNIDAVGKLLKKPQINVNAYGTMGCTALHIAASQSSWLMVQLLLGAKADVKIMDRNMQRTALHHAAEKGWPGNITALIEAKAQVDAYDRAGKTPLYYATSTAKDTASMELLLEAGATISPDIIARAQSNSRVWYFWKEERQRAQKPYQLLQHFRCPSKQVEEPDQE